MTSTATVSTTGTTGCFTFRVAFFTGVRLGLALATVRLRALPRLAEFPLRSFARFCTFDCFLRLAMIAPASVWCSIQCIRSKDNRQCPGNLSNGLSPDFSLSGPAWELFLLGRTGSSLLEWEDEDDSEGIRLASLAVRQPSAAAQENGTGGQGKAVRRGAARLMAARLLSWW
jgi:hypothetical protein